MNQLSDFFKPIMNVFRIIKYLFLLLLGYLLLSSAYFVVAPSQRGLKMRLGTLSDMVYSEGFHWKMPILDVVRYADLRIDKADGDATSASKDLQNVETKISIILILLNNSEIKRKKGLKFSVVFLKRS